jgi:DnaJ family protein B protein 4
MMGGMSGGGMRGMSGGGGKRGRKPPPTVREVGFSLEELYSGTKKRLKVTRTIAKSGGGSAKDEKVLEIDARAGWKKGTKVTFEGEGDKPSPSHPASDIVFVIGEKPHPIYKRDKDDLIHTRNVTVEEALVGLSFQLKMIDGAMETITVSDCIGPGYRHVVRGRGMPNSKTGQRGNLIITFNTRWPRSLSQAQKDAIRAAFKA